LDSFFLQEVVGILFCSSISRSSDADDATKLLRLDPDITEKDLMNRLALLCWIVVVISKSHSFSLISTTAVGVKANMNKEEFVSKYLRRLKLDPNLFHSNEASLEKLRILQEAHLARIPFENLSQHGCSDPATVLDIQQTANKILSKHRGGFCFELNGLFAELLIHLGYTVGLVPAYVSRNAVDFVDVPTHVILIVSCGGKSPNVWFVDVGFGEPALHPLQYDNASWDQVQITPEGMQSKICKLDEDVVLYWWSHATQTWLLRLKWNYRASLLLDEKSPRLAEFGPALATIQDPASIFSQKLICCRLTRERKFTVAGNRFKVTGSPRFPDVAPEPENDVTVPVHIHPIASEEELRAILRDHFDIPTDATGGIALQQSLAANPEIWSHM
jgi:N-hydroxyarylamine O-acetyltransferase